MASRMHRPRLVPGVMLPMLPVSVRIARLPLQSCISRLRTTTAKEDIAPSTLTPMMAQYWRIRSDPQYDGFLLLFQIGSFLEAFFGDAEILAATLNIALTRRGSHQGKPIPLAGIPLQYKDAYLAKLVRAGVRVVVCEQSEGYGSPTAQSSTSTIGGADPPSGDRAAAKLTKPPLDKEAGGGSPSGIVRRRVTRVVTRGTVVDDVLLAPRSSNYLAALSFALPSPAQQRAAHAVGAPLPLPRASVAWLDISTGDFFTKACASLEALLPDLASRPPVELLVPAALGAGGGGNGTSATISAFDASVVGLEATLGYLHRCRAFEASTEQQRATEKATGTARLPSDKSQSDTSGGTVDQSIGQSGKLLAQLEAVYRAQRRDSAHAASAESLPAISASSGHNSNASRFRGTVEIAASDGEPTAVTIVDARTLVAAGEESDANAVDGLTRHLPALERAAATGLLSYVRWTQQGSGMPMLRPAASLTEAGPGFETGHVLDEEAASSNGSQQPQQLTPRTAVEVWRTRCVAQSLPRLTVDPSTRRALELTRPMHGRRRARGSLLHTVDMCVTPLGSRTLDGRLCAPLAAAGPIHRRLDAVGHFLDHHHQQQPKQRPGGPSLEAPPAPGGSAVRESARAILSGLPDLERTLQRLCLGRWAPRDLLQLRTGLHAARGLGLLLATGDHVRYHPSIEPSLVASSSAGEWCTPATLRAARRAVSQRLAAAGFIPHADAASTSDIESQALALALEASRSDFDGLSPMKDAAGGTEIVDLAAAALLLPLRHSDLSSTSVLTEPVDSDGADFRASLTSLAAAFEALCDTLVFDSVIATPSSVPPPLPADDDAADLAVEGAPPVLDSLPADVTALDGLDVASNAIPAVTKPSAALQPPSPQGSYSSSSVGGSMIRPGFEPALDAARALRDGATAEVSKLEARLRAVTGVRSLRVRRSEETGVTMDVPVKAVPALQAFGAEVEARLKTLKLPSAKRQQAPRAASAAGAAAPLIRVVRLGPDGGIISEPAPAPVTPTAPSPAQWPLTHALSDSELPRYAMTAVRSLKSTTRFACPATAELDSAVAQAAARASALETLILQSLVRKVVAAGPAVSAIARAVAVVDVSAGLAELAARYGLTRPTLLEEDSRRTLQDRGSRTRRDSDSSRVMHVVGSRHLVVERALLEGWAEAASAVDGTMAGDGGASGGLDDGDDWFDYRGFALETLQQTQQQPVEGAVAGAGAASDTSDDDYVDRALPARGKRAPPRSFMPNDIALGLPPGASECGGPPSGGDLRCAHVVCLTGSNMAGKSTYLRSAAHVVVLAQMGAFVPAASATLSVADRLFARVGASDDVTRDRSTFFVEMEETAAILAHATARSFVVIDEVGRGTSAVEGLTLAAAILGHLARVTRCRALFATHYHELTTLPLVPALRARVACMTMAVDESQHSGRGRITHRLVPHPIYTHLPPATAAVAGGQGDALAAVLGPASASPPEDDYHGTGDDRMLGGLQREAWWRLTASQSGAVQVAAMAGLPRAVCEDAETMHRAFQSGGATALWHRQFVTVVSQRLTEEAAAPAAGTGAQSSELL